MKKQTAVEWLEEKLLELFENHFPFELLEQAKAMDEEQRKDIYENGYLDAQLDELIDIKK